jgi:hypothetical protein
VTALDESSQFDPNQLPSGTNVYFLVIVVTSFMVAFWSGQFLPGPEYFTTPFDAPIQVGISFTWNGVYGAALCLIFSCFFFLNHVRSQSRAFGPAGALDPQHEVFEKIGSLSHRMRVPVNHVLVDRDIKNADAIAFGFYKHRSILIGKGMLWLSCARPVEFIARTAHELAHLKNGDVKYAFLSRALLQANLFLMAIVAAWACFQPARTVMMQYFLFTKPAFGLAGASPELFFKLHGARWLHYWLNRSLGILTITLPVFAFWALLLFLEYRSLLRTRELLADAQAARWAGSRALLAALNADKAPPSPSLADKLFQIFSAHPLVSERIQAVRRPEYALNPTLLRFLFLGYLYSLVTFILSSIGVMISTLNQGYSDLTGNSDVFVLLRAVIAFDNPVTSLLYLANLVTYCSMFFIVLATLLRSCLARRIARQSTAQWCVVTLLQVVCFGIGDVLGSVFRPYGQALQSPLASKILLGQPLDPSLFLNTPNLDSILWSLIRCGILVATAILFWIEAGVFLRGSRSRPIRAIEWGLLMLFTFLFCFQLYGVLWYAWSYPQFNSVTTYAYAVLWSAVYLTPVVLMTRLISGRIAVQNRASISPPLWARAA